MFYSLLISLLVNVFFFAISFRKNPDKFTDLAYGLTFLIVASVFFAKSPKFNFQVVLFLLTVFWALRLSLFLFVRVLILKRDVRYNSIRGNKKKIFKFWFFQAISVWIIYIPAILIISKSTYSDFGVISLIGFLISICGIILETTADIQKFIFKIANQSKWTSVGLWKYSRYPNYFGEMLVWWGIWIFSVPYLRGLEFLSVASPFYISYLLLKVTGVPLLEKLHTEKYGSSSEYQKYLKSTNLLIPVPRSYIKDSSLES